MTAHIGDWAVAASSRRSHGRLEPVRPCETCCRPVLEMPHCCSHCHCLKRGSARRSALYRPDVNFIMLMIGHRTHEGLVVEAEGSARAEPKSRLRRGAHRVLAPAAAAPAAAAIDSDDSDDSDSHEP